MNQPSKKVNLLFLSVVILHLMASILVSMLLLRSFSVNLIAQLLLSELTVLIPAFVFLLIHNCSLGEWLQFKTMKWSVLGLTIVFTYLIMPFITFINLCSQLFTENAVMSMNTQILELPLPLVIFIMGVFGPFCEEFVFRGIIYQGYKKEGSTVGALVLSGLLFGLMHMNFNQFCYATVLGIVFALLVEATHSLWASVTAHIIINTHNVVLLIGTQKLYTAMGMDMQAVYEKGVTLDEKLYLIGFFLILSAIFTAIAVMIFIAICRQAGTLEHMQKFFARQEKPEEDATQKKHRLLSLSGIFGILICLFVMFAMTPLMQALGF